MCSFLLTNRIAECSLTYICKHGEDKEGTEERFVKFSLKERQPKLSSAWHPGMGPQSFYLYFLSLFGTHKTGSITHSTYVAMIDNFLTLLPNDTQKHEWWLVVVKIVVLPVPRPRHSKNVWHYDCLIWHSDHHEIQEYHVVWSRHEGGFWLASMPIFRFVLTAHNFSYRMVMSKGRVNIP